MRKMLVYLLSFCLAYQPSAWSLTSQQHNEIRDFLNATSLAKRAVSFGEFYQSIQSQLSPAQKQNALKIIKNLENEKIPKLSVTKNNGRIQLSFVNENQVSGTLDIIGSEQVVLQINGVKISPEDTDNTNQLLSQLAKAFPQSRLPELDGSQFREKNFGLLSALDVEKLSALEKKLYFKKLQALLETMEKMNGWTHQELKTTSHLLFEEFFPPAFAKRIISPVESAAVNIKNPSSNTPCIYAGYLTTYGYKVKGIDYNAKVDKKDFHVACGGGESKFYTEKIRDEAKQKCKGASMIACNPLVYGDDPIVCTREKNITATQDCNSKATAYEAYPRTLKDANQFDQFKSSLVEQVKELQQFCSSKQQGQYLPDQNETCKALELRIDEILNLTCDKLVSGKKERFQNLSCELIPKKPSEPGPGNQTPPDAGAGKNPKLPEDLEKLCVGFAKKDSSIGIDILNNCAQSGGVVGACSASELYIQCRCTGEYGPGNNPQGQVISCFRNPLPVPAAAKTSSKKGKKEDWTPAWIALGVIGITAWMVSYAKRQKVETPVPANPVNGAAPLPRFNNRGTQ